MENFFFHEDNQPFRYLITKQMTVFLARHVFWQILMKMLYMVNIDQWIVLSFEPLRYKILIDCFKSW